MVMATTTTGNADVKPEPVPVDEAVVIPEAPVAGEVEAPYSIYTNKEKWLIVAMVALAGFYRYVSHRTLTSTSTSHVKAYKLTITTKVPYQQTSTSRPSQPSPPPSTNPSTTSIKP
jgi:hypothetical protein